MQQELFPPEKSKDEGKALKSFMQANFCFSSLKKAGLFKNVKFNDYEEQAKRLCRMFGYESIYEYGKHEIRCHISYAHDRPIWVDEKGELKTIPFVEVSFPNQMHI